MDIKKQDIIVCGFALFAIFFGAGNLIFPPYLGVISGNQWWVASLAFTLSDPFFPILGVIVTLSLGGKANDLGKRVHPYFASLLSAIAILLIGPFFSVPRTGATTHEIFVQSFFPLSTQWITSLIFFGLTAYIAIKPSQVVDAIGKYLTPALLIILAFVCGAALLNPPGPMIDPQVQNLFSLSFKEGYQTMDALGAALMAGIVISDLARRGYTDKATQIKAGIQVGLLAFGLLAIVYIALAYAGATVSSFFTVDHNHTLILIEMVHKILGPFGKFALGLTVALACLTTSIGLTSICGNFFYSLFNQRISYQTLILITVTIEFIISLIGVNAIIHIAVPVLSAIYPIMMVLILFSIFDQKIHYDATYVGAVIGAGSIGLIQSINLFGEMLGHHFIQPVADWTYQLPLNQFGFEWLLPALITASFFTLIQGLLYSRTKNSPL